MANIYGPVKPGYRHPDRSQPIAAYQASVVDVFEAARWRLPRSEVTAKESATEQGPSEAVYWLISTAALISFLVGFLSLLESVKPRTDGTDQLDLAAQGAPSQADVTIGQAIQALGVQH